MGEQTFGIDPPIATQIAREIGEIQQLGVQTGVVIGGGNMFRGLAASARGMDRSTADYMGMLATVINALALQDALEQIGVTTRVATAIEMRAVAEPFIRRRAIRHLEKGRVVDLRGRHRQSLLHDRHRRGAARDGDARRGDPQGHQGRRHLHRRSDDRQDRHAVRRRSRYLEVLERGLKVMDATAISLCMDNKLPIVVFNLRQPGNLRRVIMGEPVGTTVMA